ncbi:MAG: hypothetical protein HZC10_04000 [Nitrospirae bacterium]|nr:hypothetical protein [Nitrospirota bacterium]
MKIRYLILILILISSFALSAVSFAEEESVVSGTIESVKGNSISVGGSSYNISGVLLLDSSGNKLSTSHLAEGKRVEIFLKNNNITSVVVYENISNIIDDENIPK